MSAATDTTPGATPETPRGSLWARLFWVSSSFIGLLLLLGLGVFVYHRGSALGRLEAALAELDENEPGWRAEDLFKDLPELPEAENSSPRILNIVRALPRNWADYKELEKLGDPVKAPHALGDERLAILDGILAPVQKHRLAGRELIKYPRGRHPVVIAENPIMTLLDEQQKTREFAQLMDLDALERAQRGDIRQALLSARACLNASRVLEDEPFLISQLIRIAIAAVAMKNVERALALGEADADLAEAQKHLAVFMDSKGIERALRGERALMHVTAKQIIEGKFSARELEAMAGPGGGGGPTDSLEAAWKWLTRLSDREMARRDHPDFLRTMTKAVEAARLPPEKQAAAEAALENEVRAKGGLLTRLLMPATMKVNQAGRRSLACARAMVALIACERYRLAHGKWPAKLDDLVPAYLVAVPADPIDGKPLRYRTWAEGVVVYSVGTNGVDDGGDVERFDKDFGYRLWDKGRRRQPAPPLVKEAMPPGGPGGPP